MDDEDNPCVGICMIADGYCVGCGRSEEEIHGTDTAAPKAARAVDVAADSLSPLGRGSG